ncbi:hypothetical protein [Rubinisphaera italica]|uniref:hypothetical protein n=1 Tax=Rubinisphaera italica TaxID=2527969 RepID=UPI0013EF5ACE|nr:hypothetical protein [Rubinisphaera italica]
MYLDTPTAGQCGYALGLVGRIHSLRTFRELSQIGLRIEAISARVAGSYQSFLKLMIH